MSITDYINSPIKDRYRNRNIVSSLAPQYIEQQRALDEIAKELDIICFRPDYHAAKRDCNTVLFYTHTDHQYNLLLEKQAGNFPLTNDDYKRQFFSFENTDINGQFSLSFANRGSVDLRLLDYKERLKSTIELALEIKMQNDYTLCRGGILFIEEADDEYNDYNRRIIDCFYKKYGTALLGTVNFKDKGYGPFTQYNGEKVYNFGCDFIIPKHDEMLEKMILAWNGEKTDLEKEVTISNIYRRVENISGIVFKWF